MLSTGGAGARGATPTFSASFSPRVWGASSWEFPILVRRTLWHGVYAGAGYAPRVINGSGHTAGIFVTSLSPPTRTFRESDIPGTWDTTHGVVGAAGIEKRIGPLHIAPEVR